MAHIRLPDGVPGILSLFAARPETAKPLCELAETLLRGPSPLAPGERELIASYVSRLNGCRFCCESHSAAARELLGARRPEFEAMLASPERAPLSPKLKALLGVAAKVQQGGPAVGPADVEAARREGATDLELHDTVLIAAAFCMFNRYVDGLAAWAPSDPAAYDAMGKRLADHGYLAGRPPLPPEAKLSARSQKI